MALQEETAAAEVLPLGRPDLDDVFAVCDGRLPRERHGVETAARARHLETIRGVQGGIVPKRLHEISRTDVPPAGQRRVAVEMQLPVLQMAPVDEVLVLPD